jgi:hypothetical protein
MSLPYADVLTFVQQLTPTWRKTQHEGFADLLAALWERPTLCLTELARAFPRPAQPLHGRLKRLTRWLDNPRLDELALSARWLKLSYHFSADEVATPPDGRPLLPVLIDTTYFEPFALLLATVPCGSRGLPIALTTKHRTTLEACFPPRATGPTPHVPVPPVQRRRARPRPAAAVVQRFLSQNHIEEPLLALVQHLITPALRPVYVGDRGLARASLFRRLRARRQEFVIRIDSTTHVRLRPDAPSRPVAEALAVAPGERQWAPQATYQQSERVPVNLLAVWDPGQEEPWYLATPLDDPTTVETLYRWRMRQEATHRDFKTGVLLREGDDHHQLTHPLHLHRLLLALATAEWLCALVGLQAWQDLPAFTAVGADGTRAPTLASAVPLSEPEPSLPPPVSAHRGPRTRLPAWLRRFAVRGLLSYVRLGCEVLRAPDLGWLVRRLVHWLGHYLWSSTPLWRPRQERYRRRHWWPAAA